MMKLTLVGPMMSLVSFNKTRGQGKILEKISFDVKYK